MLRINLLPPEIGEKRKFEQRIGYVIAAGILVMALLFVVYGFLAWQVSLKNDVLQQAEESATQLRDQAQAYRVFEEKESVLTERKEVADKALAGRIDWGRIANEVSLVLPSDVWLKRFYADEGTRGDPDEPAHTGFEGYAVDTPSDVPDVGHKAVAKTLVRLADLELLTSVWLDSSEKECLSEIDNKSAISFIIKTGVVQEPVSMPAPPNQTAP